MLGSESYHSPGLKVVEVYHGKTTIDRERARIAVAARRQMRWYTIVILYMIVCYMSETSEMVYAGAAAGLLLVWFDYYMTVTQSVARGKIKKYIAVKLGYLPTEISPLGGYLENITLA